MYSAATAAVAACGAIPVPLLQRTDHMVKES